MPKSQESGLAVAIQYLLIGCRLAVFGDIRNTKAGLLLKATHFPGQVIKPVPGARGLNFVFPLLQHFLSSNKASWLNLFKSCLFRTCSGSATKLIGEGKRNKHESKGCLEDGRELKFGLLMSRLIFFFFPTLYLFTSFDFFFLIFKVF